MSQEHVHLPPPPSNPGLTFLGMSGGILALAITLVIVLPLLACVGCCLFGGIGALFAPDPSITPTYTPYD